MEKKSQSKKKSYDADTEKIEVERLTGHAEKFELIGLWGLVGSLWPAEYEPYFYTEYEPCLKEVGFSLGLLYFHFSFLNENLWLNIFLALLFDSDVTWGCPHCPPFVGGCCE